MRRDIRRFAYFRWSLVEVPQSIPLDPIRIWRERYGFLPPLGLGGIVGYHFVVDAGVRAVKILRPETLHVPDPLRNRLLAVIAAKHRASQVRLAASGESPALKVADRLPRPSDRERVEQWPDTSQRFREPLVAELMNAGVYLTRGFGWGSTSGSLDDAIVFSDVEEAEAFLASLRPRPAAMLRYRAACLAESDLREVCAGQGKEFFT